MRIAIHDDGDGQGDIWIAWCEAHHVAYRRVDCLADNIVEQVQDCDGLLWWWKPGDPTAALFAQQLTRSLEMAGKPVFPSSATSWHFDDKLGQKYLFEAAGLPLIPAHVFYSREEALIWADDTEYPKVFKLRAGFRSEQVRLIKGSVRARQVIGKAFGRGIPAWRPMLELERRVSLLRRERTLKSLWVTLKGVGRVVFPSVARRSNRRESGYVYFQDFVGKDHVIFVTVSADRAWASKLMVPPGDFRASGNGIGLSGHPDTIPPGCIELAFKASDAFRLQFLKLEMIVGPDGPLIVEADPYFFPKETFPGYWDRALTWHPEPSVPGEFIVGNFVRSLGEAERPTGRPVDADS